MGKNKSSKAVPDNDNRLFGSLAGYPAQTWSLSWLQGEYYLGTGANLLLAVLVLQITLAISTLLLVVPVPFAAAHQAAAVVLLFSGDGKYL